MAGIAGETIGITQAQAAIAGAQALVDASTVGKGCTTNFIGFGLGATATVQTEDFNATDDTVTLGITAGDDYEPDYTTTPGDLEWIIPTP